MKSANFIVVSVILNNIYNIYVAGIDIRNIPEDLETSNNFFVVLDNSPEQYELVQSFFGHNISNTTFNQDPLRDFCLINIFADFYQTQQLSTEQQNMLLRIFTDWGYMGKLNLQKDPDLNAFVAEDLIQRLIETQTIRRIR